MKPLPVPESTESRHRTANLKKMLGKRFQLVGILKPEENSQKCTDWVLVVTANGSHHGKYLKYLISNKMKRMLLHDFVFPQRSGIHERYLRRGLECAYTPDERTSKATLSLIRHENYLQEKWDLHWELFNLQSSRRNTRENQWNWRKIWLLKSLRDNYE